MAESYKILGQVAPVGASAVPLYTVPGSTEVVISTITVCNRSTSDDTFRISATPGGGSVLDENYLAYDVSITANSISALTIGITAEDSDVINVTSTSGSLSFSAFGSEIS